jgi:hypothetical protein
MQVHLFASAACPSVSAFTNDWTGRNLPDAYAPWLRLSKQPRQSGDLAARVEALIQQQGFFLLSASGYGQTI